MCHRDPLGLYWLCFSFFSRGVRRDCGPHSTKLPQSRDTESDQLGVPASLKPVPLGIGYLGRRVAPHSHEHAFL